MNYKLCGVYLTSQELYESKEVPNDSIILLRGVFDSHHRVF